MTTLFEPVGLPALGMGGIFWFPTIANTSAPKKTESTLNLTCVPDAGWEPTFEESAGSHMKYCSEAEYEVRGKGKWTGGTMQYEFDPQNPDDVTHYKHVTALAKGTRGYLGHRLGLPKTEELDVDQYVDLYPVEFGQQVPVPIDPSTDGQLLQLKQRFFVTGEPILNVKIVAGA